MIKRLFALLLVCSAFLLAQTSVNVGQVAGAPTTAGNIFVVLPDGRLAQADLGPNLTIDLTGTKPVLKVVIPPPAQTINFVDDETLTASSTNPLVYPLAKAPIPGTLKVYRNGMRQRPGVDYTASSQSITFVSYYATDPGALVSADYRTAAP